MMINSPGKFFLWMAVLLIVFCWSEYRHERMEKTLGK